MEEQRKIKLRIKSVLPYGSLSEIKRILESKNKSVSLSHIRNVLNPNNNKWDLEIIEEANRIAEPIYKQVNELSKPTV